MPGPRYRWRRAVYIVRRPLWSLWWVTSSFRFWRDDVELGRMKSLYRACTVSLTTAAWHATGCNRPRTLVLTDDESEYVRAALRRRNETGDC